MSARISFLSGKYQDVMKAMLGLSAPFEGSSLEPALLELVKIRASQLNGWNRFNCAFNTVPGGYKVGMLKRA